MSVLRQSISSPVNHAETLRTPLRSAFHHFRRWRTDRGAEMTRRIAGSR